jgi:transposase
MAARRRRRFWSDDEKRRIVSQARVPGISVSQVARRYDVNANLVFKWLRDPRFRVLEEEPAAFLPVEVVSGTPAVRDAGLVEAGTTPCGGRIEIALPNGPRLIVSGGLDPDLVTRLVRGLSS